MASTDIRPPHPELLEDLFIKFICTAPGYPEHYQNNPVQLVFLVESAYWHYQDVKREADATLPNYQHKFTDFAKMFVSSVKDLELFAEQLPAHLDAWHAYKQRIPVCGAILLDKDMKQVLLVSAPSLGHSWGFPRGKINKGEPVNHCAAREVYEETGLDLWNKIKNEQSKPISRTVRGKVFNLYILSGFDATKVITPENKHEVELYKWHSLEDLKPLMRCRGHEREVVTLSNGQKLKCFGVAAFVRPILEWVHAQRQQASAATKRPAAKHAGSVASSSSNRFSVLMMD